MQVIDNFFIRKSTPKNGIKQKPIPLGADADIPLYVFRFLLILFYFFNLMYVVHCN